MIPFNSIAYRTFDSGRNDYTRLPGRIAKRTCNICSLEFAQKTRFDRFCDSCKEHNDYYRYAEWAKYS